MKMRRPPTRVIRAMSVAGALCAAANAYGAGFAITEQSGSGMGNAFAGTAASARDASTIFFNPAGMTLLPDRQAVAAVNVIDSTTQFSGAINLNPAVTLAATDRLSVGIGLDIQYAEATLTNAVDNSAVCLGLFGPGAWR